MSSKFPATAADILAVFLSSFFYGIHFMTFVNCQQVLLWKEGHLKPRKTINYPLVIVALVMFALATVDVAYGVKGCITAFVFSGNAKAFLNGFSNWTTVRTSIFFIQTFIGDGVLIYRCWIVWTRRVSVIVLPMLVWLGQGGCSLAVTIFFVALKEGTMKNPAEVAPFFTSALSLSVATNVITTFLIVYRIWKITSKLSPYRVGDKSLMSKAIRIWVESGLLYTGSVIILLCVALLGGPENPYYAFIQSIISIVGITFDLIIIRIDREKTLELQATFSRSGVPSLEPRSIPMQQVMIGLEATSGACDVELGGNPEATVKTPDHWGSDHDLAIVSTCETDKRHVPGRDEE